MTLEEFVRNVRYMRTLQKRYFKTKSQAALRAACAEEVRVDQIITALSAPPSPTLFQDFPQEVEQPT